MPPGLTYSRPGGNPHNERTNVVFASIAAHLLIWWDARKHVWTSE